LAPRLNKFKTPLIIARFQYCVNKKNIIRSISYSDTTTKLSYSESSIELQITSHNQRMMNNNL